MLSHPASAARAATLLGAVYGPPTAALPLTRPVVGPGFAPRPPPPSSPPPPPLSEAALSSDWQPRALQHGHGGRYLW